MESAEEPRTQTQLSPRETGDIATALDEDCAYTGFASDFNGIVIAPLSAGDIYEFLPPELSRRIGCAVLYEQEGSTPEQLRRQLYDAIKKSGVSVQSEVRPQNGVYVIHTSKEDALELERIIFY